MTKNSLAEQFYMTVENGIFMKDTKEEIIENIKILLGALEPIDRPSFSKWGLPEQQSTTENCWE